jgi:hypothetical protein
VPAPRPAALPVALGPHPAFMERPPFVLPGVIPEAPSGSPSIGRQNACPGRVARTKLSCASDGREVGHGVVNRSNSAICSRTTSRLARQKAGERTAMPKRAARSAAGSSPVDDSRSS